MTDILSTGNDEIDRQFGRGLPVPSLVLLEGDHGTGKSAMVAQLMSGFLGNRTKVMCVTESTTSEYVDKMKSITFNFTNPFLQGKFSIVPLQIRGSKWSKEESSLMLPLISKHMAKNYKKFPCVVIDSLSLLTMYAEKNAILDFFSKCKQIVAKGTTVIVTIHENDLPEDVALRIRAMSDVYLKLGQAMIGGKIVKTVNTIKLIGAKDAPESSFAFEVDMVFGIKIVPVSMANA